MAAGFIKGCLPGPSSRLRKELVKYAKVIDIDEYRTSKTCNECGQRNFKNMINRQPGSRSQTVHAVLHCKTSGCQSMTMNRDVNASRNKLKITVRRLGGVEPPECSARQ